MTDNSKKNMADLIEDLTSKGGMKANKKLSELAMNMDRDVTDVESGDLGDFTKQTVTNGYTCVIYPAGARIMMSVHG